MKAHNTYQRELGYGARAQYRYRLPRGPAIGELIRPGSIVSTNYSGPSAVLEIVRDVYKPPEGGAFENWTLVLARLNATKRRAEGWINEVVAVDGRLLHLFENNDDEVFVHREFQFSLALRGGA